MKNEAQDMDLSVGYAREEDHMFYIPYEEMENGRQ
jgi:hypothetical protein